MNSKLLTAIISCTFARCEQYFSIIS